MFKKLFTISLVLLFASTLFMAQTAERIVLKPGGGILQTLDGKVPIRDAFQRNSLKLGSKEFTSHKFAAPSSIEAAGTIDTMTYPKMMGGTFNVNFVFDGQDVEFQWFVAPADLTIKAAGFSGTDVAGNTNNSTVSVRLMKLNWTEEELKDFTAAQFMGTYPSVGDGMNESDPFGEAATGPWEAGEGAPTLPPWTDNADPESNTWEYDLWSDFGIGYPITVEEQADINTYQWVEMNLLSYEPTVLRGEIFAVVLTNDGVAWDDPNLPDRIGLSADASIYAYPGWKYYEAGRLTQDQPGWWQREYTWNFAVIADLTGDRPPVISNPTQILSGLDAGPFTVEATITDDNPSGGNAGVASAVVSYAVDGGGYTEVTMSNAGDLYSADIPAQAEGSVVEYKIVATDVEGGVSTREMQLFKIWAATAPTLVLENGPSDYLSYYFGYADFPHDTWTNDLGAGTSELFELYDNIVELTGNNVGPANIHDSLIALWLSGDGSRNYALLGDEYLGAKSGWTDGPHEAGDFVYDVLGVTYEYNDINMLGEGSVNTDPSIVEAVEGSGLGDSLFTSLAAAAPGDTLWYHPDAIFGGINWLDGVDVTEDTEVDMVGYGSDGVMRNVAVHRTLPAGNKIAFLAYDVLSLLSLPTDLWWSSGTVAPHYQVLSWWEVINSVRKIDGNMPSKFKISQNYPNPFNPSTVIRYSVPEASKVTLKIFNTLGQEVAELVNTEQATGNYEVDFNASHLSSGVYFYTMKAGQFTSTKKMMLIK